MKTAGTEYSGVKHCPSCGKDFECLWPTIWAYKRGNKFFCSYHCTRKYDIEQEGKPVQKVSLEQKKRAVQIAINGEDPRPYLQECGSRNADLMWGKIREKLKTADPETFAQLPDKIPRSDKGKSRNELEEEDFTPEDAYSQVVEVPEVKMDGPIRISATEPEKVEVKPARAQITKPLVYDGLEVCEVKGNFARYRRVDAHGNTYIDVEMKDGDDTLSFTVEQWRSFRKEHDHAALILGVEL